MYERPRINVKARDLTSHVSLRDVKNGKCQVVNVIISVFKPPA